MLNKLLVVYIVTDLLFLLAGGLVLGTALLGKNSIETEESVSNVAQLLLLSHCPLTEAMANAGFVFFTFLLSLPAIILSDNRLWLKIHGWFVVISSIFTLSVGLSIWRETLQTRDMLNTMWLGNMPQTQSLLQQKFDCCGYWNSTTPPYKVDSSCPTELVAAQKEGCVGPFSNYANSFLDIIFTAAFGVVAIDVILLLCVAMLLKDRKDQARYRLIDAKNGFVQL